MVTSLKKISVRYVKIPTELAKVLRLMAVELQTESMVRSWRQDSGVSVELPKPYESLESSDNGRNYLDITLDIRPYVDTAQAGRKAKK